MEYFLYISKFIYRLRWWLLTVPIFAAILAIYSTKHLGRTYNTNTTIYTGVISGYTVEATSGARIDFKQQSTTLDNILNIITSESTLKRVSLRLFAQNMMHGDPNNDNNYIQASTYRALLSITPKEVQRLIDKKDEKKTLAKLRAYEKPNSKNFVFGLFNWFHPDYSYSALLKKVKVNRIGDSDMIEINYSSGDPGIAYNTLKILNEEFTSQYQELRFGETNDVIKFYEEELSRLARILKISEDSLTEYNINKKIINYEEQTKQVTIINSEFETKYQDFLLDYNSSKTLVSELEKRMDNHIKSLRNNAEFINRLQNISKLTSKITDLETFNNESSISKNQNLNSYKNQLKKAENDFTIFAEQFSNLKFTKEGIASESIIEQWLEQILKMQKAAAQLNVMDSRKGLIDEQYLYYSPIGSTLKRKERSINFTEQNYLSMLNSLNAARLRQKNLQMTSATLKIMNPPVYPISAEANKRKSIVMAVFFGCILFILGFFLIIELLDRTLRDKVRTEKLTSCKVIGAFPENEIVRFKNFNKIRNLISIRYLSNTILCYLSNHQMNIINLISTENGDGKSYIGKQIEDYWISIGLNVKRLTWHEDFANDSREFLLAQSLNDFYTLEHKSDILIIEYPPLKECSIPIGLLNEANLNLVIARANRTWKFTDQLLLDQIKQIANAESPVVMYLNKAEREVVESFTGLLPPSNKIKKIFYRFSQLGLTASE
nr:exopolysaccharide biosynthesis protein [uncultured Bacteroides sp.]